MTHQSHPPRSRHALRQLRASSPEDRRRFQRFGSAGLMVRLGDQFVEVEDISLGGLRVARQELAKDRVFNVQLMPREGSKLALNDAVMAEVVVVGSCDKWTRLGFTVVNYTLAKTIIRQIARLTGVQPFIVK